ncbi:2-oxoacid:acceptor oxidoreductase family protein [bacterium]|nr:2-oxoacid:acceptor oxidoreductase family protein [bacterium]MBQ9149637.1 2-oxoacid:acceptor oxidoreductase family protein [bacterium]
MIKNFLISGSGGQGVLSIGSILANIFMLNDLFVTYCSCYGAEMRGGAVNCEINMSDKELYSIQNEKVDFVIALNQTSFDKFISKVKENGTIIVNSSLAKINKTRDDIQYIFAPLTQEAQKLGNIKMTNSIALGILSKLLGDFPIENVKKAYEKILSNKTELIQKNIDAYNFGLNYAHKG